MNKKKIKAFAEELAKGIKTPKEQTGEAPKPRLLMMPMTMKPVPAPQEPTPMEPSTP